MKISGFTFIKNGDKLYIPTKEAITSILPICDEFIVALGDCDADDRTEEIIKSINSDKIKIVRTVWDVKNFPKNTEFARQTEIAKSHCSGDWFFYIQCDEAIHENDLSTIKKACEENLEDKRVEGFIFKYLHFWGDYEHHHMSHAWYRREIRIIRNDPSIHSWKDAQSFRKFSKWNGSFEDFDKKIDSQKLRVKLLNVHVYHYGYVRPPILMTKKRKVNWSTYHGAPTEEVLQLADLYDYGDLSKIHKFEGTHPSVMKDWIGKMDWKSQLRYSSAKQKKRRLFKHEKTKYRLISWVENNFFSGETIGGFKNFFLLK